jgi:hypothetical protein
MLDVRSFWAFPVETAGRQMSRLPVRCGLALQLRLGAPAGVLLKADARLRDGMGWGPDRDPCIDE